MAFTYCRHCGFKNLYSMVEPKFCGSCGSHMSGEAAACAATMATPEGAPKELPPSISAIEKNFIDETPAIPGPKPLGAPREEPKEEDKVLEDYETNVSKVPEITSFKHKVINADGVGGRIMKMSSFLPSQEEGASIKADASLEPMEVLEAPEDNPNEKVVDSSRDTFGEMRSLPTKGAISPTTTEDVER